MTEKSVWMVDQLAAAKVVRELDLGITAEQTERLAALMAEHRVDTLDLGVTRIQSVISQAVRDVLLRNQHRDGAWSDGCRSAESAIFAATFSVMNEMRPRQNRTTGQVLRSLIRQARSTAAAEPLLQRIDASGLGARTRTA